MPKGGLGGGLGSLFADNAADVQMRKTLRISEIEPDHSQPRKLFDERHIATLAESIREHGMIQPILVRPLARGGYQIVAGERRWRAARMLALKEIPVIIQDLSDIEAAQIALIENLQREDLNPIEEAKAFQRLQEVFHMTQEEIAKHVGCSRSRVSNALRLLKLPEEVQEMLIQGELTTGHAKVLLSFRDDEVMIKAARKAAEGSMSVRQLEKLAVTTYAENTKENPLFRPSAFEEYVEDTKENVLFRPSIYGEIEQALTEKFGRKVTVSFTQGKGELSIEFFDEEDLKSLAHSICPEETNLFS